MVVAASFLLLVIANGALFLLIVAMKDIAAAFDWPRSIPSTAYSLQFIGGGLGGIVMGWWLDKAGMGKPAMLGAVTIGLGSVAVSFIENGLAALCRLRPHHRHDRQRDDVLAAGRQRHPLVPAQPGHGGRIWSRAGRASPASCGRRSSNTGWAPSGGARPI